MSSSSPQTTHSSPSMMFFPDHRYFALIFAMSLRYSKALLMLASAWVLFLGFLSTPLIGSLFPSSLLIRSQKGTPVLQMLGNTWVLSRPFLNMPRSSSQWIKESLRASGTGLASYPLCSGAFCGVSCSSLWGILGEETGRRGRRPLGIEFSEALVMAKGLRRSFGWDLLRLLRRLRRSSRRDSLYGEITSKMSSGRYCGEEGHRSVISDKILDQFLRA